MGLSGDEEWILAEIKQRLAHDDPLFMRRVALLQRRIYWREIMFFETLCVLIVIVGALLTVALVTTAGRGDGPPPSERPLQQVSVEEEKFTVFEPR
jgi:hypothetical protein